MSSFYADCNVCGKAYFITGSFPITHSEIFISHIFLSIPNQRTVAQFQLHCGTTGDVTQPQSLFVASQSKLMVMFATLEHANTKDLLFWASSQLPQTEVCPTTLANWCNRA